MENIDEDKRYINKVLNKMKIDDEEKFMSSVANVIVENNKEIKKYKDMIIAMNNVSISYQTLCDYLINSVAEHKKPVWTEEHIKEMLDNFVVRWKA